MNALRIPATHRSKLLSILCCLPLLGHPVSAIENSMPAGDPFVFHSLPEARFNFGGVIGERVEANVHQWLLCAPQANPGILEMFRVRDRKPVPQLVPWAGEFTGKYLISAVQALRMTDSPALRSYVSNFVAALIATQAEDGYLGPFLRERRLLGEWDLWGHYHVMQGLLDWHEQTGDPVSLQTCRRAGDLICRTYLDQPRRVFDAGSHEMNMAVIHGLGRLHRLTGEARYLRMMREIEKDWERAGDYFRTGIAGVEFFATPRPRWESLHDLQGLVELWQITGDSRYRDAFIHHWRSIARWDRHNTGGFSSGEQATGNAWSPAAIETCCTIAWMALSVDMLRLTGDARVADELELSTLSGALGAQHPSGRWWTYNTPMDGVREASAHSIVFQSRAGTPELNCCSVNGPRALGMLSEWAVMTDRIGLVLNWLGPGEFTAKLGSGAPVELRCESDFPLAGRVKWIIRPGRGAREFSIRLRIPAWSVHTRLKLNGTEFRNVRPGDYFTLQRRWRNGDTMELDCDMSLRAVPGDREAAGKVSVYRGPLLLAYDQRENDFDEAEMPRVDLKRFGEARVLPAVSHGQPHGLAPWLRVELPAEGKRLLRLTDFANAGASGTRYRSWLPAKDAPPRPPITRAPADGATIGAGKTTFRWTTRTNASLNSYRLIVSAGQDFSDPVLEMKDITGPRFEMSDELKQKLKPNRLYQWRVVATGPHGETPSAEPAARFRFDPAKPPVADEPEVEVGPDGLVVRAALRGKPEPEFGRLKRAAGFATASGPDGSPDGAVNVNGHEQMLVYSLPEEFSDSLTIAVWVRVRALPEKRIGQVFSAWAAGMDDPLRLTVDGGKLFARVESQQGYSTKGVPIEAGQWHHVAAVRSAGQLALFVDGQRRESAAAPESISTVARSCALGGNPNFSGNEFLAADFARFTLALRAFSEEEIRALARLDSLR